MLRVGCGVDANEVEVMLMVELYCFIIGCLTKDLGRSADWLGIVLRCWHWARLLGGVLGTCRGIRGTSTAQAVRQACIGQRRGVFRIVLDEVDLVEDSQSRILRLSTQRR